jgi:NADH dehydrogenase
MPSAARPRVLVTGGAGFVGTRICRAMCDDEGPFVFRAFDRPGPRLDALRHDHGEVFAGDVLHPDTLRRAMQGVEAVVHLIAAHEYAPAEQHERLTLGGLRNLCAVMRECGVRRLLFMSSIKAARDYAGVYGQTKRRAESIVRDSGLDWTIFRPGLLYGPGELKLSLILRLLRRWPVLPIPGDGSYAIYPVHADDLAAALVAALQRPRAIGRTYFLVADAPVTLRQIVLGLSQLAGVRRPWLRIPLGPCDWIAAALERVQRSPMLFRDQVQVMQAPVPPASNAAASRDLDFSTPPMSVGLPRWWRQTGGGAGPEQQS